MAEQEQSEFEKEHSPLLKSHGVHHISLHDEDGNEIGRFHELPKEDEDKDEENKGEHSEPKEVKDEDEENKGEHGYPGMIRKQGRSNRF